MDSKRVYLGLDVGTQRIGLALGDSVGRVAQPLCFVQVDGKEAEELRHVITGSDATDFVVGRPRNQLGEPTAQTKSVENFVTYTLQPLGLPVHWQDESVTSVIAEQRLIERKKPYTKGDIDAEAACIILQDFLEQL